MKYKNLMARALYDNVPECAEELAFRKGDILTVIEQNTGGLEGWWLCSLHGRQGIVPGNRVKLLIGPIQETPSSQDQPTSGLTHQTFGQQKLYQAPNPHGGPRDTIYQVPPSYQHQGIYQVPTSHGTQEQDVYQLPSSVQRSIGGANGPHLSKKVITPVRTGQGYVYEYPSRYQKDIYDIPPSHTTQGVYDIPPSSVKVPVFSVPVGEIKPQGVYDIPPTKGGKEEFERQQKELLEKENIIKQSKMQLEHHQLSQFQLLEQEITKPVENDISKWKPSQSLPTANSSVGSQDRQLLYFYYDQCETHYISLLNAIDALFSCVSSAQPPRIFVAHSKFVILSAHKLVFIGDTLTRQVATQDIRHKVMNSSNQLCEQLKTIVMATKMAALHYPSTTALQEMVHHVTDLSRNAQLFKRSLLEMATF
uniref:Neural cell expressed, developmentally down-regulated 9 n=1 Tax=Lynx canadensis TaxID=61383 RepID=A0A667ICW0_LYNCA